MPRLRLPSRRERCHLVIGDSHATPQAHNHRYDWLGRLVADLRPDVVVDIGDWWDMPSLCSYDEGKKSFEGRRYADDIAAGVEAQDRVAHFGGEAYRRAHKIRCLGNHEYRICRLLELEPRWEEHVGLGDLQSEDYGWETYPYLTRASADGLTYCHFFKSPGSDRPIAGVHPCRAVALKCHTGAIFGHTHRFGFYEDVVADGSGRRFQVFNAGCYFGHSEDWAGTDVEHWRRGLLVLRVDPSCGEVRSWEWLDYHDLWRRYGGE